MEDEFIALRHPLQLPQPTLADQEHGFSNITTTNTPTDKSQKTFQGDCPTVGLSFSQTIQPCKQFCKGSVKYTTREAVPQMLFEISGLQGNHGCIVDKNYFPDGDAYNEGTHYTVRRPLGRGANGIVSLCNDRRSGKPFVMKKLEKRSLRNNEVLLPLNPNHENVTKFYGLMQKEERSENGKGIKLTMQLMIEYGGIGLNHYLLSTKTLAPSKIWDLTRQGLSGLQYLHSFGIVHHDVKPENLVCKETAQGLVLKLTDFGSARFPQDLVERIGWTFEYLAPECCKLILQTIKKNVFLVPVTNGDITGRVDVFAFGLVVMCMYTGDHMLVKVATEGEQTKYKGFTDKQKQRMRNQLVIKLSKDESLVQGLIPDECDPEMRQLLQGMTQHYVKDRFTAEQALDFLKEREARHRELAPIPPPKQNNPAIAPPIIKEDPVPNPIHETRNQDEDWVGQAQAVNHTTKQRLRLLVINRQKPYSGPGKVQEKGMRAIRHKPRTPYVQKTKKTKTPERRAMRMENVPQLRDEPRDEDVTEHRYEMKVAPNTYRPGGMNTDQAQQQAMKVQFLQQPSALEPQGLVFGSTMNPAEGIPMAEGMNMGKKIMQPMAPVWAPAQQTQDPHTQGPHTQGPPTQLLGNLPNWDLL